SGETTALLAMLLHPDRADCAVGVGGDIVDDGLARLGRMVVLERVKNSTQPEARARAEWLLRYRLPDHEITKLAESLNVTGWRLQNRLKKANEALEGHQKAIAGDPPRSWPS